MTTKELPLKLKRSVAELVTSLAAAAMVLASLLATPAMTSAAELPPLSISMEGYPYPYPVHLLPLNIQGQDLRMAYMDVKPESGWNGRTVMLLHGKNFFGSYWGDTIRFLTRNGYRVVVPDQIGFGKSSKPEIYYSFHLLAANTKKLLDTLGVKQVAVVGHSMGGMLATRFTLMYPEMVTQLVLENPIGLEDYRSIVPYASVEELYRNELNQTELSIRNYHKSYFVNWKPGYGEAANVALRWRESAEYPRLAMSSALTYEMIYTQPVCHEFQEVKAQTLLVIGQSDRTVVGKARVKKEVLPFAGQYPELGRKTAKLIPNSTLVEVPNCGHIPHLEAKDPFQKALLSFLGGK
jgi:pimeloyl-ACP methyl ester carboxylesterase